MNELCVYHLFYRNMNNRELMFEALKEAKLALLENEVPVGAVISYKGEIIGRGHNQRNKDNTVTSHAEIIAINEACKYLNCWHLDDCSIYVTLEPCQMCAGAIMQSRIEHVFFGASDEKAGSFGSVFDLSVIQGFNHYPIIHAGVMENECKEQIELFFKKIRNKEEN